MQAAPNPTTQSPVKLCECGCNQPAPIAKMTDRRYGHVKGQSVRYCHGHHKANYRHGGTGTPEYMAYRDAKKRCTNPRHQRFHYYGGRGIKFLFESFEQFLMELGPRPSPRYSLDRINNDGNYEPGNVRWATQKEQRLNSRPKRRKGGAK